MHSATRTKPAAPRRSEKSIEAEIIQNLQTMGFRVTKTSQPRPSMITRGVPDLYASHARWRLRLWIEVKAEGGRPTLHQKAWHAQEREAGGVVVVAWSWSDVQRALVEMGAQLS